MDTRNHRQLIIDARDLPASERHSKIISEFRNLPPGEKMHIISDHEPIHLIQQIIHEGISIDEGAYSSTQRLDGAFETILVRGKDRETLEGIRFTSIDQERHYLDDRFSPVGIYSGDRYKVILTYLKAGQCIPVHSPSVDLIFAVLKGTGTATAGKNTYELQPGSILIVTGGERRGVEAKTDMEAIHLVSPTPSEEDHIEVEGKIERGECV